MSEMESVARELGLLVRSLKALHHGVLADVGVRVELPAAAVLGTLEAGGQVRASALAEAMHLDLSSVSRQLAALEREGWVSRVRDPLDSRAALVDLTQAGRDVLRTVRSARVTLLRRLLPDWSEAELGAFASQLHRFRSDLAAGSGGAVASLATVSLEGNLRGSPGGHVTHTPALAGSES